MNVDNGLKKEQQTFLTLKGGTGIAIGIIGIFGSYFIRFLLNNYTNGNSWVSLMPINFLEYMILGVVLIMFFSALLISYFRTKKRMKKRGQRFWTSAMRYNLLIFSIPLLILIPIIAYLYNEGQVMVTPGLSMFAYGLALINLSRFRIRSYFLMGLAMLFLGILGLLFIPFSILFWGLGFGLLHLLYGSFLHKII
jgi:hypothetical protein